VLPLGTVPNALQSKTLPACRVKESSFLGLDSYVLMNIGGDSVVSRFPFKSMHLSCSISCGSSILWLSGFV
jgi:hypothetical protein